jgi:hypothetical protein
MVESWAKYSDIIFKISRLIPTTWELQFQCCQGQAKKVKRVKITERVNAINPSLTGSERVIDLVEEDGSMR